MQKVYQNIKDFVGMFAKLKATYIQVPFSISVVRLVNFYVTYKKLYSYIDVHHSSVDISGMDLCIIGQLVEVLTYVCRKVKRVLVDDGVVFNYSVA